MSLSNDSPLSLHTTMRLRTVSASSLDISYVAEDLTARLTQAAPSTLGGGAFSDLYKYKDDAEPPSYFAIKQFRYRLYTSNAETAKKRIKKEIRSWSSLTHGNILQLEGILFRQEDDYPCLVSRWMDNGTASRYCATGPNISLMKFVLGIADGLQYMHQNYIAHGDIRGDNILVSESGQALICDFGLSKIFGGLNGVQIVSSVAGDCAMRYRAPEFHASGGPDRPTPSGDVFMFGQTLLELWSGKIPYPEKKDPEVVLMLSRGELPNMRDITAERTEFIVLKERVHSVCSLCWIIDPVFRPSIETIRALIFVFAEEEVHVSPLSTDELGEVNRAEMKRNDSSAVEDSHKDRTNSSPLFDEGYTTASDHQSPSPSSPYDLGGASSANSQSSLSSEERTGYISSPIELDTPSSSMLSSPINTADSVPPAHQTMASFLASLAVNNPEEMLQSMHDLTINPEGESNTRSNTEADEHETENIPVPLYAVPPPPPPTTEAILDNTSTSYNFKAMLNTAATYLRRQNLIQSDTLRYEDSTNNTSPPSTSSCILGGIEYGRGSGRNKKEAQANAAAQAIRRLFNENPDGASSLQYLPIFQAHLTNHNLLQRVTWDEEQDVNWICKFIVDDTIFAQGRGTDKRQAKEAAARNAATRWIDMQ